MRNDKESRLDTAIHAMQSSEPGASEILASAKRVADRIGIESDGALNPSSLRTIESCADVLHLRSSYRAGTLADSRALLIRAHLRDCSECYRSYSSDPEKGALDWSLPQRARSHSWNLRAVRWALAPTMAALALTFFLYRAFWQLPPGVRAEVESIDGSAYRTSDAGDSPLAAGDKVE